MCICMQVHKYVCICGFFVCFFLFFLLDPSKIPFDNGIEYYKQALWHFILLDELIEILELQMNLAFPPEKDINFYFIAFLLLYLIPLLGTSFCICFFLVIKLQFHMISIVDPYPSTVVIIYAANPAMMAYQLFPFFTLFTTKESIVLQNLSNSLTLYPPDGVKSVRSRVFQLQMEQSVYPVVFQNMTNTAQHTYQLEYGEQKASP